MGGPPAIGSGVLAMAIARLAQDESEITKQREWARQVWNPIDLTNPTTLCRFARLQKLIQHYAIGT